MDDSISKATIDIIIDILNIIKNSYNFKRRDDSNNEDKNNVDYSSNISKLLEICETYSQIGLDFTCLVYSILQ